MKPQKPQIAILVLIILLLSESGVLWAALKSAGKVPSVKPGENLRTANTSSESATAAARCSSVTRMYRNEDSKIEFACTPGWRIAGELSASPISTLQLLNYISDESSSDFSGKAKIEISVINLKPNVNPTEWVQTQAAEAESDRPVMKRDLAVGNELGVTEKFDKNGVSTIVSYVAHARMGYIFYYLGDPKYESLFYDLLNSVRYLP